MPKKNNIKVVLTGGHAFATAYALIQFIKQGDDKWNISWIGPRSLVEGKMVRGVENEIFNKLGVKVFSIDTGRIQRKFTVWTIPSILKIPKGFLESFLLLTKIKPDVVVSFGGFVGFPVVIGAKLLRIPTIIHEQTATAGRGNLAVSKFADKVAISRPSSFKYFPQDKTFVTGNPIDSNILALKTKTEIDKLPTILVTGGHTGSITINSVVISVAEKLLKDYKIVHQTGSLDFERVDNFKKTLKAKLAKRYFVYPTIGSKHWPIVLGDSDIIISRAGANIVSQILSVKRPSILIPIPFSYLNEQLENARYVQKFGLARIIEEEDLNGTKLIEEVNFLYKNWKSIVLKVREKESPDINASKNLTDLIRSVI